MSVERDGELCCRDHSPVANADVILDYPVIVINQRRDPRNLAVLPVLSFRRQYGCEREGQKHSENTEMFDSFCLHWIPAFFTMSGTPFFDWTPSIATAPC